MRASLLILITLAAVVTLAWVLYNRPAHAYQVNGHRATWRADVNIAMTESLAGSPITPTGHLRDLPGVGTIATVFVTRSAYGPNVAVLFMTGTGGNASGLAYLHGYPPPPDTCNTHLSGPWWQISSLNYATSDCPRGFHFTPGG
ncbi:MAG TPA: hypothetical protein VNT80_00515 [Acidimicrobiales bacterium]|nr:hypothetical protein [Acidimicrobiales bacterium]